MEESIGGRVGWNERRIVGRLGETRHGYGVAGLFRDGQKGDSAIAHRFSALLLGCTGDAEFLQLEIQMFNFQT